MKRVTVIAGNMGTKMRDRMRSMQRNVMKIGRAARIKGERGKKALAVIYRKALDTTGRVMAQALDVIFRFCAYIVFKCHIEGRISRTGKKEVLPDAQSQFIAEVIENVILINTSAPGAQHIHIRICGAVQ